MALTTLDREALTKARALIAEGREIYICHALQTVADHRPRLRASRDRLKAWIERELLPCYSLDSWNADNGRKVHWRDCSRDTRREWRLQWIDWMLNEPKAITVRTLPRVETLETKEQKHARNR